MTGAQSKVRAGAEFGAPATSYDHFNARTWREHLLHAVLVELTYRCNLDCVYCYNDVGRIGRPLSNEQYFALLAEMAELGVLHLTLSGGEPLAHPGFFAIGGRARELGFVVRVKSNGHALRGRLLERLRDEVDPFLVDVSLHGAVAATHDRQTRIVGSFERLIANVREMLTAGVRVKMNMTLTRWNEDEIEACFDLAESLGTSLAVNTSVTPRDDGDLSPLDLAPTRDGLRRFWALCDRRFPDAETRSYEGDGVVPAGDTGRNCGAGSSSVTIDPYGDVLPCVQWRRPLGNLHERSLPEIWSSSPALGPIRELTAAALGARHELEARGGARVDFCPGLSEMRTGDPLGTDPELVRRQAMLAEYEGERRRSRLPVLR